MKHLTPRRVFSDPHQMLIRLFNSMAGSFTQRALLISQSGSASSQLNVSSPPKGQGFHIRFSDQFSIRFAVLSGLNGVIYYWCMLWILARLDGALWA